MVASAEFSVKTGWFNLLLLLGKYDHVCTTRLLCRERGMLENVTIRNVAIQPEDKDYRVLAIREGHGYVSYRQGFGISPTVVKDITVDGLCVTDGGKGNYEKHWIEVEGDTTVIVSDCIMSPPLVQSNQKRWCTWRMVPQ